MQNLKKQFFALLRFNLVILVNIQGDHKKCGETIFL